MDLTIASEMGEAIMDKVKILIVDDDKEIVQLLEIYARNEGYEPLTAYNGKDAITKLNTMPDISLVILDLMMPEMNGMDVIRQVRKDSSIPILVLSAKTADMDKIQGWWPGPTTTLPSLQPAGSDGAGQVLIAA